MRLVIIRGCPSTKRAFGPDPGQKSAFSKLPTFPHNINRMHHVLPRRAGSGIRNSHASIQLHRGYSATRSYSRAHVLDITMPIDCNHLPGAKGAFGRCDAPPKQVGVRAGRTSCFRLRTRIYCRSITYSKHLIGSCFHHFRAWFACNQIKFLFCFGARILQIWFWQHHRRRP